MASTHNKSFHVAEALTDDSTSPWQQLIAKESSFIGFFKAASVHASTVVSAKIQHSPDASTWYDLLTFSDLNGVDGDQKMSVNAVEDHVFQYVRGVIELAGATQEATCTLQLFFDR